MTNMNKRLTSNEVMKGPKRANSKSVGVDRWGTSQASLGIPLDWPQICGARVVVETGLPDFNIDPSLGTHFMHNVIWTSDSFLEIIEQGQYVVWCHTKKPLSVIVDGTARTGVILKGESKDGQKQTQK
ncbi:MAG: hypothetical protein EZS28_003004 [Streblomastix strix]|uniref:Uncharacterized protein n=1 Tax=Streblomastix strix TaxID=222440 RepID=A0A5J4X2Q3_9EUKA|nr:MAG: hypothetical protein EZS28_003004 [Streblomastix strix]